MQYKQYEIKAIRDNISWNFIERIEVTKYDMDILVDCISFFCGYVEEQRLEEDLEEIKRFIDSRTIKDEITNLFIQCKHPYVFGRNTPIYETIVHAEKHYDNGDYQKTIPYIQQARNIYLDQNGDCGNIKYRMLDAIEKRMLSQIAEQKGA